MPWTLAPGDSDALSLGCSLLGGGGGGSPHLARLLLTVASPWPVVLHELADLPAETPCIGLAFVGSTLILQERLPGREPFATTLDAIERWLGTADSAVCPLEGAGVNGLAVLPLAGGRRIVDVDCMGRALPDLDQISLLVDGVPGLVAATVTGEEGVVLLDRVRPRDLERVVRTALECNGGWAPLALGGFTVGDLREHGIGGTTRRAVDLGRAALAARDAEASALAARLGGRLVGVGRVVAHDHEAEPLGVMTYDVRTSSGDVLRLIARSEFVAALANGIVTAVSPTIISVLDAVTRTPLQLDEVAVGKDLMVIALPSPAWWTARPERQRCVDPQRWGLLGLAESRRPS